MIKWLILAPFFLVGIQSRVGAQSVERVTFDGLEKRRPSWSADGKLLAFSRVESDGVRLCQYLWEPGQNTPPRRLLPALVTPHFDAVFAPDGSKLLMSTIRFIGLQGNLDLAVVEVQGKELKTIVTEEQSQVFHQEWGAWSPDGQRIAFSSTHEGNQEIYVARADGTDLVRLTQNPGHEAHPSWHPDGTRIAFATDRFGGGLEIATVRTDGSGLTRITNSPGLDDYPAFSPDGKRLAFVSNRDGNYEVYLSSGDGSSPQNLTRQPARDSFPCWTRDGKSLTFVSDRDGGCDLYTQRFESHGVP